MATVPGALTAAQALAERWHILIVADFDADGLLNPDKNIPSLHRCAEFGGMHIRGGELPFPELPRF